MDAMTGDIDAAGDIVTGAPIAQVIAPSHRGGGHGALCLNCGTRLLGEFCHACGQDGHVHRTIAGIGHDIAHGVFHFEGRIWRTLPMLVRHPGALTRRYVAGERQRFVPPLALFLFTVFLMFAAIATLGGLDGIGSASRSTKERTAAAQELARLRTAYRQTTVARDAATRAGHPQPQLDREATIMHATIRGLELADAGDEALGVPASFRTGWARLDEGIARANANPALVIYKLQSSAYKYSWALIPLSVPFVALLFLWRRRHALYDHAIFVTYSIAFMMLLVIVLTLAGAAGLGGGWIAWAALLVPPAHMFAQLRGAYLLSKAGATWRTVALTVFAFTVLTTWLVLLLLHGLTD
jgi:hypothetical protein